MIDEGITDDFLGVEHEIWCTEMQQCEDYCLRLLEFAQGDENTLQRYEQEINECRSLEGFKTLIYQLEAIQPERNSQKELIKRIP